MSEKEMKERLERIVRGMQALNRIAEQENRDLTDAEQGEFEELKRQADAVVKLGERGSETEKYAELVGWRSGRVQGRPIDSLADESQFRGEPTATGGNIRALTVRESIMAGNPVQQTGYREEDRNLSLTRMLRGVVLGDWKGADAEIRALGGTTGSGGAFFVPDAISNMVIDLARNKAVTQRAGAQTIAMQNPELHIVRVKSDPVGYWRPEHGEITESDPTFDNVTLKAQSLGVMVRMSVEILQDAANFEGQIRSMIAAAIAVQLDTCALTADGVAKPLGILACNQVPEISLGKNGGILANYDPFSQAVQTLFQANCEDQNLAVVHSPRTWGTLDRLKETTTGAPLRPPKSYERLLELTTNSMPTDMTAGSATDATASIVGKFDGLIVGMYGGVQIEANRYAGDAFGKGQVLIRALVRTDTAIVRPSQFCKIVGIKPS